MFIPTNMRENKLEPKPKLNPS